MFWFGRVAFCSCFITASAADFADTAAASAVAVQRDARALDGDVAGVPRRRRVSAALPLHGARGGRFRAPWPKQLLAGHAARSERTRGEQNAEVPTWLVGVGAHPSFVCVVRCFCC